MRRYIFGILLLMFCNPLAAQRKDIAVLDRSIAVKVGYFTTDLNWSIAGNSLGENPDIYSELKWQNQAGPLFQVDFSLPVFKGFFIEGRADAGSIKSGKVSDTDYSENRRVNPVFNISLPTEKGSVYVAGLGLGYQFRLRPSIELISVVGYSTQGGHLYLLNDETSLNSSYQLNWKGAFLKSGPQFTLSRRCILLFQFAYYQLNYSAKADWNLIEEFAHPVSFKHTAKGFAIENCITFDYNISGSLSLNLKGSGQFQRTGKGVDQLFLKDGKSTNTQLNSVNQTGLAFLAGLKYHF